MPDKRVEALSNLIREWIGQQEGRFSNAQLDNELGITTPQEKAVRRVVIKAEADKSKIRRIANLTGTYRVIDREAQKMNWQSADPKNVVKLKFPFELEKYVKIFPKSIIIVAGAKEQCKTLFCYDFTLMNMYHPLGVDLYNSETGGEQMRERLDSFDIEIPNPAPFEVFERYDNFADCIDPNRISVIDYLDMDSEVYMVGAEINHIFQKLDKGVALIALQKPPSQTIYVKGVKKTISRDLAYGGAFSAKRAVLYLSLDNNTLKIVYAKNRANPKIDPKNMRWSFSVNDTGTEFINPQKLYDQGELQEGF